MKTTTWITVLAATLAVIVAVAFSDPNPARRASGTSTPRGFGAPAVTSSAHSERSAPAPVTSARLADLSLAPGPAPASVRIETASVDAPVVPTAVVRADDGTLDLAIPDDPVSVGWYEYGPAPGQPGSAVLAAHVDSYRYGPGVFFRLGEVEVGDQVVVDLDDGSTLFFEVNAVDRVPSRDLPALDVFARDGSPRLTLITCGGDFDEDRRRYEDNVIVTAVPAEVEV